MKITASLQKLAESYVIQVEDYIKLCVRPKPKWLPAFIWRKLLYRLLTLEVLK